MRALSTISLPLKHSYIKSCRPLCKCDWNFVKGNYIELQGEEVNNFTVYQCMILATYGNRNNGAIGHG